jgi:dolichol-phosphate mannosyltransferase
MSEKAVLCSVLVPTFNEAENIASLLCQIHSLPDINCEIFVIDDHSSDQTASIVEREGKRSPTYLIQRPSKLGIGSAYREAFPWTTGSVIAVMDADFSHDPEDLRRMLQAHDGKPGGVVFSSRYTRDGGIENWPFLRRFVSFVANGIARFVLRIPFTDVTSAFRVYSRDVFAKVVDRSFAPGFAFQVEAAFWSKVVAQRTTEIPVTFRDRAKGKSKFNIGEIVWFVWCLISYWFMALGYK